MKRFAKYLSITCVAFTAGLFATSCSSSDDVEYVEDNESETTLPYRTLTVYQNEGTEKLSTKVAKMDGLLTRSSLVDPENNTGIHASWIGKDNTEGLPADKFKFYDITVPSTDHHYMEAQQSTQSSTIKGNVICDKNHEFSMFYPFHPDQHPYPDNPYKIFILPIETDGYDKYKLNVALQHGTLDDIASNHDFLYVTGKIFESAEKMIWLLI